MGAQQRHKETQNILIYYVHVQAYKQWESGQKGPWTCPHHLPEL